MDLHTTPDEFVRRFAHIDLIMELSRPSSHYFALQELLGDPGYEEIILRKFGYTDREILLHDLRDWRHFSEHCAQHFSERPILFTCFLRVERTKSEFARTVFVHSGKCICEYDDTYLVATSGDIIIIPPNIEAGYTCYEAGSISVCTLTSISYFRSELLPKLPMNSACGFSFFDIYTGKSTYSQPLLLHSPQVDDIFPFLSAAMIEEYHRPLYYRETLDSYLVLFFTALLRFYTKDYYSDHFSRSENGKQMFDIKKYIYDHCETVTLSELADVFHFKSSYLSQFIKKSTDHTFTDLVQSARMEKVCTLLKSSTIPVTEIVNSVGYQNIGYFYRIFTEEYGITPSEYRRQQFGIRGDELVSDSRL